MHHVNVHFLLQETASNTASNTASKTASNTGEELSW